MCFVVYNPRDHDIQIWKQQISKAHVSVFNGGKSEDENSAKKSYTALCKKQKTHIKHHPSSRVTRDSP